MVSARTLFFILSLNVISALSSTWSVAADGFSTLKLDRLQEQAPDLSLSNDSGETSHLSQYRGKKIILHFWASWCTPCREELVSLQKLAEAGKKIGVVLLPVSADEMVKKKEAAQFIATIPGKLPFFIGSPGKERDEYLTWGVPVTYFINESGSIIGRAMGPRGWAEEPALAELISSIFKSKKDK